MICFTDLFCKSTLNLFPFGKGILLSEPIQNPNFKVFCVTFLQKSDRGLGQSPKVFSFDLHSELIHYGMARLGISTFTLVPMPALLVMLTP